VETLERLLVTIEGSSELLRQELKKAGVDAGSWARDTEQKVGSVDNRLAKLGSTLRSALGALGVGFSVGALVNFTRSAIQAADAVGETARAAGFSAERFQRLQFVFRQNGVAAQEFDSAMRSANTRLGQFITTGAGPAAKAIEELGLKQRIANGEIRTNEQFVEAIIEALGKVKNSAERAALAAAFFGREAGAKLQDTLGRGTEAINAAAEAATGIFTDETVRQADALGDAWERIASAAGNFFKSAAVQGTFDLARLFGIDEAVKQFDLLESQLARLEHRRAVAAANERSGLGVVRSSASFDAEIAAIKAELEYQRLINTPFIQSRPTVPPETAEQRRQREQLAELTGITVTARRISSANDLREQRRRLGLRELNLGSVGLQEITVGAQRAGSADELAARRRASQDSLGMASTENLDRFVRGMREYGEATEQARERQQRLADAIAASFESRGMEALMNGNIREGIRGFAKDLLELVIRIAILQPLAEKLAATLANIGQGRDKKDGKSGLIDIFGSLFSGQGFAGGGRPPVGKASIVGENGPELWVPDVPGRIVAAAQTRMAMAGGPAIEQHFHVQAGLPPQWESQLRGVTQIAATAAFEAVSSRLGGRR
jgi:minor tail protein